MQPPRIRLEIRGIMAAVAVAALILCVYRVDVAPSVTVVLILGCTSVLAQKRYCLGLAKRVNEKQAATRARRITLMMTSVIVSVTIIGLSDAAFMVGYYGYLGLEVLKSFPQPTLTWTGKSRQPDLQELLEGIFCGFVLAMIVAVALRCTIWPIENEPPPLRKSTLEE